MANDTGTDGSPQPDAGRDAAEAASVAAAAAELPGFPRRVIEPPAEAGGALPPPLKPDATFRGIAALAADKRPMLREVAARRAQAAEPEPASLAQPSPAPAIEPEVPAQEIEQAPRIVGMPFPSRRPRVSRGRQIWFALSFVLPVLLGAIYIFFIAPDQYVTEFRFNVRLPVPLSTTPSVQTKSFLFNGNTTPGTDLLDNYTITDYVTSRQAALDLNAKLNLRDMYNRPSDPLSRVGVAASAEKLARFWSGMVYSNYDPASGLAVVRVRAYSAQDSYAIATNLVTLSSELVNRIGMNSEKDTVRFAQEQYDRATAQVATMNDKITELRRRTGFLNPDQGQQGPVNNIQSLFAQQFQRQSQLRGQIEQVTDQLHNPDAPQLVLLRQQLAANTRQLAATTALMKSQGNGDIADAVTQYESLSNKLHAWQGVQKIAINTLAEAQAASDAQRVYLTTYVKPTLPESPIEPNRWLNFLLLVIAAAMVWAIGRLVENSILEHG